MSKYTRLTAVQLRRWDHASGTSGSQASGSSLSLDRRENGGATDYTHLRAHLLALQNYSAVLARLPPWASAIGILGRRRDHGHSVSYAGIESTLTSTARRVRALADPGLLES